jgi:hypothetical protein
MNDCYVCGQSLSCHDDGYCGAVKGYKWPYLDDEKETANPNT